MDHVGHVVDCNYPDNLDMRDTSVEMEAETGSIVTSDRQTDRDDG